MKGAINIMCLYWVGDFRGRHFKPKDVWRLHETVTKHSDRKFDFYVLTNDMSANLPGTKIPLLHAEDWPGWWAKMELYRPDLPEGRTLYMDLDSHAISSLAPILDFEGDLVLFDDRTAQHEAKHIRRNEGGWVYRYQAATILFNTREWAWLYDKFKLDWDYYLTHYRSDQDILGEWIPNQPTFPREWLIKLADFNKLYYRNVRKPSIRFSPPDDVIIVTGQPKNGLFSKLEKIEWFEKLAR